MNNKVTLPPISDIFANKEPQHLGAMGPHQLPYSSAGGYPVMPMYSYNYMNAAAAAAAKSSLPPLYPGTGSSYMYGSNFSGYSGLAPAGARYPVGLPRKTAGGISFTQTIDASTSSPPLRSPELELSSPEAGKSSMLQTRSRTRNNLPKETTYILLKWLNDHLNHPYPNSFEKTQLMMTTGLNQQQLSNWFINARRRKIKALRQRQKLTSN
ncbi:CIC11C00000002710 [Sungouiella intermedia]|uniref:CIC11C00000002710 n=1 Tax=Sungouiella intermedia TaxID=45354 RepID=A0A1L0BQZ7_9ASCO|nr:CIC11C00000002710 [[Candida] intermedia]